MRKKIAGYCPTLDKDYSITVTYIDGSTLSQRCLIKDTFRCEHNTYGDACTLSDCPLYESAPDSL